MTIDFLDPLKYEKLELVINGKNYLDNSSFRGAVIEEKIDSPFVFGTVYVDDWFDLRNKIRLDGTQNVSFSYKPLNDDIITFPNITLYRTNNITDTDVDNQKRLYYGIGFCSKGYTNSTKAALSKNYELTSPYTIYRDAFGICGMPVETGFTAPVPISENFYNERLQTVLSRMEDKIDTTQANHNSCLMMTYYNRTTGGVSVKLIDEILTTAPNVATFKKYSNQSQTTMFKNSILEQKCFEDFDTTKREYVNFKVSSFNESTGRVYTSCPPVVINFNMGGRKIFEEMKYYNGGGPNVKIITHENNPANDRNKNVNFLLAKKHRLVMDCHMDQNKGVFRIPPNSKIKVGVRCKLEIRKRISSDEFSDSLDDRNSGIVLVTGVKHHINISTVNPTSYMDVEYIKPEYYGEDKKLNILNKNIV